MSFGVYVHIPYCVQRCSYCDFATYEYNKILPPEEYIILLKEEIKQKHLYYPKKTLTSLYFGGGTPSLIPAHLIQSIIEELKKYGFDISKETEVTIEINPYTIDSKKLEVYLGAGINRFSVGAQTFDDHLLKMVKREHDAQQTLETLALLRSHQLNFNFDLLFALPRQSLDGLKKDLEIALQQGAKHLSPYCLTVPDSHPLSQNRPLDHEQVEMFSLIHEELSRSGFNQYEISNYSLPGHESKHNLLYWTDQEYWGIGLSAHSYRKTPDWGLRFWNNSSIADYKSHILSGMGQSFYNPPDHLVKTQYEVLEKHQSLTDFCHTSMRLQKGLNLDKLTDKFSEKIANKIKNQLNDLAMRGLVQQIDKNWSLSRYGVLVSNQVFSSLTFLKDDLVS